MKYELPRSRLSRTRLIAWSFATALLIGACNSVPIHPITTYSGHCEAVLNPPDPNALSSKARYFAPESSRVDFTRWYDSLTVAQVADAFLGGASVSDSVVVELRRLKMIGVWQDGTHLHVANALLRGPDEGAPVEDTFNGSVDGYRRYLNLEDKPPMSDLQRCLFAAVNAYFEDLTVHGPQNAIESIPAAYYMKSHEQYNQVAASK